MSQGFDNGTEYRFYCIFLYFIAYPSGDHFILVLLANTHPKDEFISIVYFQWHLQLREREYCVSCRWKMSRDKLFILLCIFYMQLCWCQSVKCRLYTMLDFPIGFFFYFISFSFLLSAWLWLCVCLCVKFHFVLMLCFCWQFWRNWCMLTDQIHKTKQKRGVYSCNFP